MTVTPWLPVSTYLVDISVSVEMVTEILGQITNIVQVGYVNNVLRNIATTVEYVNTNKDRKSVCKFFLHLKVFQ